MGKVSVASNGKMVKVLVLYTVFLIVQTSVLTEILQTHKIYFVVMKSSILVLFLQALI
jgi:hypothetical protein